MHQLYIWAPTMHLSIPLLLTPLLNISIRLLRHESLPLMKLATGDTHKIYHIHFDWYECVAACHRCCNFRQ